MKFGRGDAYLLLTVVIWGNTFPTAKYVLGVLPPTVYASTRYLLAAATLMIVLAWRQGLVLPRRQDWLPLIGFDELLNLSADVEANRTFYKPWSDCVNGSAPAWSCMVEPIENEGA